MATVETPFDAQAELYHNLSGLSVAMLGGANVIMQLSLLPVGHGVALSKVESGRVDRHPVKRARTTLSYLAIALFGTEAERAAYRSETNRSHRQVRSEPGADVEYNAFDTDLQMWVGACLYVGFEEAIELAAPHLIAEHPDELYVHGSRLGTTLQVTEEMWPADREAFQKYWEDGVARIEMDDVSRTYLQDFARLGFLPAPLKWILGPAHRFLVTGFLPAPFREELRLRWSPARQRLHDTLARVAMAVDRHMPKPIRRFPLNAYLRNTQRRIREGRAIV